MSKAYELIKSVLESKKLSGEKVYGDQPLIFTAAQMKSYTPPEYAEMRGFALKSNAIFAPASEIFYCQAKFMEQFTDDFEYQGQFIRSFPTYREMSTLQLRGYFSWRTKVRGGEICKTSASFPYIYIFELLNLIGANDPEDGFLKLKSFSDAYSVYDAKLKIAVSRWLIDFAAYYNISSSFLNGFDFLKSQSAVITLMNFENTEPHELLGAFESFSAYKISNAAFYKKYPELTERAVYKVFEMLCGHYGRDKIYEKLFGKKITEPHFIFNQAVFYEKCPHPDCVYKINDIFSYKCVNNSWSVERFYPQKDKAGKIGSILKTLDFSLRRKYGFKTQVKPAELPDDIKKIIFTATVNLFEEERKANTPEISIDLSKLQSIRDTADITREKLIVAEEETETAEEVKAEPQKAAEPACIQVLKAMLRGEDPEKAARLNGIMLSVATDEINERLFDEFGDTVIIFDGDTPEIIEDYKEDLKGMFDI